MFFINAFMRNHQVPCWILVCKPFQKLSSRHLPKRHRSYPLRPVHWAGQAKICKSHTFRGVWKKGPGGLVIPGQHASLCIQGETKQTTFWQLHCLTPSLWFIDIILKLAWDESFEIAIIECTYHNKNRIRETWACLGLEMIGPLDLRNTQLPMFASTDSCKVGQIKGMFQLWCLLCIMFIYVDLSYSEYSSYYSIL